MTQEETRILAMVECMLVWDRLAESGQYSKSGAIKVLRKNGNLLHDMYVNACPFCDYFDDCSICLWPGRGETRCVADGLYIRWCFSLTRSERRKAARKILNMLKNIPMED